MKKNHLILFILSISILSCQHSKSGKETSLKKEEVKEAREFPVLIDNSGLKATKMNSEWLREGNYIPLFIGQLSDTIKLDYFKNAHFLISNVFKNKKNLKTYFPEFTMSNKNFKSDSIEVSLIVDTNTIVLNLDYEHKQDSTYAFKAYPVYVKNNLKDTLIVGYRKFISMIMEAKNEKGEWQAIEKINPIYCATGIAMIILPPNETLMTSAFIYEGDFETDLRLRLDNNFSPVFKGKINKSQFESK